VARTLTLRRRLFAVTSGGFLGAIARYLLSTLIQSHLGKGWPYDILFINITGALILAFVTTLADATFLVGPTRRLFINVGFLGAYTTFSSLSLGDVLLFAGGNWLPALLYLFLSLSGGLLAVLVGDWLGEWVVGRVKRNPLHTAVTGEQKVNVISRKDSLKIEK
jgi:fluoride exporter